MAENQRMDDWRIACFTERTAEGCARYWKEFDSLTDTLIEGRKEEELIRWSVEDSESEQIREQGQKEIAEKFQDWLSTYWREHQECKQIPEERFISDATSLWKFQSVGKIEYRVKTYLKQWTERRQDLLTERLERIDHTPDMFKAERWWKLTMEMKEFREMDRSDPSRKAREIRATCTGIWNIAAKLWLHARDEDYGQSERRANIRDHLNMYEDIREPTLEILRKLAIEEILRAEGEERKGKFQTLLAIESIAEESCSHDECRVYRVWWMAAFKGVQFTRADLDWEDESSRDCQWGSSWINKEDLRRWVMKEIAYRTPGGQIPSRLRQVRNYLEPTEEERTLHEDGGAWPGNGL
jgi:hypothetical protein